MSSKKDINTLLGKIESLRKKLVDEVDINVIDGFESDTKRAALDASLADNEGFKAILKTYITEFQEIDFLLRNATPDDLDENARWRLMWRKKWIRELLTIIPKADRQLKKIEKEVDTELKHLKDRGF